MGFVHLGWNYSGIDSLHDRIDQLDMEIQKLKKHLQTEGILPYDEEDGLRYM